MDYSQKEFEKVKTITEKLDTVSSSFCLVRWKHATINLASGASKSCCHHSFKDINLKNTEGLQLHDNKKEQKIRQKMLAGQRPKDCSYCWWVEDSGHASDRLNWSAKSWMAPAFEDILENLNSEAAPPSWVELNFSSVCNLKCVYCSPIFSTKWYHEIKEYGPYPTSTPFNNIKNLNHIEYEDNYENTELLEKFWPWFYETLPHLRLLKITGGEPLLSPQTLKLMSMIEEVKQPKLCLGINSNLSIPETKWNEFIEGVIRLEKSKSIDRFYLHPSLDTFGERAEYIRHGLDLSLFKTNVEQFLERTNSSVHFISTLNNLALGGLLDYWKYILTLKKNYNRPGREIAIGTEVLQYPQWLNLNILETHYQNYFDEVISYVNENLSEDGSGFTQVELAGLIKARDTMATAHKGLDRDRADFFRYITALDDRRGDDFKRVFPELKQFLETCSLLV